MSVKVGVRVRPFNKREEGLGAKLCVQMQGTNTRCIDSEGKQKKFTFDYSFWSHDRFIVDQNGYNQPIDDKYADQQRVYRQIGSSILVNAWQGYNCCLFAYGQTGSGKSYSMIGYGANKGLIPIVCNSIFDKIISNQDGSRSFEVKISMMEIYNEAVRDLLAKPNKKVQLKICEHKTLGVYVQGLEKHSVDSYAMIEKKIEQGSNNRSMAATLMNESSSRSHTIVMINFVQKIQLSMDQTSVKYSCINLVDLAGSECVAKTGVNSKDRLRQTAKINQSLTTLGRVIEILAENCNKKEKDKAFVPYRDSKLTFILRNALGGNSQTAMICAISPADDNVEQTLSTLRYASRAKKIQNRAIINESDVDKLIRLLRQQNETLKKMLQEARSSKGNINYDMISDFNEMNKNMIEMGLLNSRDQESILRGLDQDSNFFEKNTNFLNQSVSISPPSTKINEELPYLTNISEDQLISYRIKYSCENALLIGNKKGDPKPDIILTTLGIQPHHAQITYDPDLKKCYIEALDQKAANYTYLNGLNIPSKSKEEMFNLDRVVFGTGCIFLLIFKGSSPRNPELTLEDIDYQYAFNEMQTLSIDKVNLNTIQAEQKLMVQEQKLRKKIVGQIEQQFMNIKRQKEEQMRKQIEETQKQYSQRIREIQTMKSQQNLKLQHELMARQEEARRLQQEKQKITEEISKYLEQKAAKSSREAEEKKQLEQTRQILEQKLGQIHSLQQKMKQLQVTTEERKEQAKRQIKKQEEDIKRDLQLQTIICHNQNIITEYKLQQNKRAKNAKEVSDLIVKKERVELLKQLTELVPQVQRFNLMAKQMNKRVECSLSIEYKYISEAQTLQVLKNGAYKSKMCILVYVNNREEDRSYYWNVNIFKNRFQHALEMFELFIKQGILTKPNKHTDPYWDPQKYETIAHSFLTLECLMFNISYRGEIVIVSHAKSIGKIKVLLLPTDSKGQQDLSIDQKGEKGKYKISNPYENLPKTIYFIIELSQIQITDKDIKFDSLKFQYQLHQGDKYSSEMISLEFLKYYRYRKLHTIKDVTEKNVIHYMEKPIAISIQTIQKFVAKQQLTSRSSFLSRNNSSMTRRKSSQESININKSQQVLISQFQEVSPPSKSSKMMTPKHHQPIYSPNRAPTAGIIFENTDITRKVQQQYQKKKREEYNSSLVEKANMKKNKASKANSVQDLKQAKKKDRECQIY